MPVGLHESAQQSLEAKIDELAGIDQIEVEINQLNYELPSGKRFSPQWKTAAAIALLVVPSAIIWLNHASQATQLAQFEADDSSLIVMESKSVVGAREDDGLVLSSDGETAQYRFRYMITNEEQLLDTDTGTVITVSQPSYEVVTINKTIF